MKKNIALVTGGYSGEAVISYKSALTIGNNLDKDRYNVYKIDIRKDGWLYEMPDGRKVEVDKNDFSLHFDNEIVKFDVIFIGMHGTPGEDGKLQSYFDMLGIPYTGCDATTSAITFNKRYTVAVVKMAGVPVANSVHIFKHTPVPASFILEQLSLPVFVKPSNGGSSIGMSKVHKKEDLEAAIAKAFNEDDQVLVEEMIKGREFTIGVFRNNGVVTPLPFTEVASKRDFFDFVAKYEGESTEETPAVVDESVAEKVRATAKKIYEVLNCRGVVRIDFIYNEETRQPYMLEVNTIPGQSEASIVPVQVRTMGWSLKDFYTKLVEEALER